MNFQAFDRKVAAAGPDCKAASACRAVENVHEKVPRCAGEDDI